MKRILGTSDVIMICPRLGVEAGMEVRVHLPATEHHYIIGQEQIQLIYKGLQIFYRLAFEMSVEIACIDASVGTSASGDGDVLLQLEADASLDSFLHGDIARLDLPAVIGLAIIRQM